MTPVKLIPFVAVFASVTFLAACNTAPAMPMGAASANSMAGPGQMAMMDTQIKTMQGMHEKMINAKTPAERSQLMAEHRKAMQDGMEMMASMSGSGMGEMKGMQGMAGTAGDMGAHQQMMVKRMEMMQTMMKMMMDQMPPAPAK